MTRPSSLDRLAAAMPLIIGVYFAVQVAVRVFISPSLGKDEAEQVLLAQEWAWGYGSQPPLYTWMAILLFRVFGEGVLALALLKNLLLAGSYLLTYAAVRRMAQNNVVAALAAASLLLLPELAWESQRALTHSILVVFGSALFTYAFVRVLQQGRAIDYALLGLGFAVGCLAKFNFPIVAIAMILAALTMPGFRAAVATPRFLIAPAVSAALLWQPAVWLISNRDATLSRAHKLTMTQTDSPIMNYVSGVWGLAWGVGIFLALLVVVYGVALVRSAPGRSLDASAAQFAGVLMRSVGIALALCVILIIAFEVTQIKDRWLQPLLYLGPIIAALWAYPRLAPWRVGAIFAVTGLCAATVIALLVLRTVAGPSFDRPNPLNGPYGALSQQIRDAGFRNGRVFAAFNLLGGNIRLQFPDSVVISPEYPNFKLPASGKSLLIWDATRGDPIPGKLVALYKKFSGKSVGGQAPKYVSAVMLHSDRHRLRLGVIVLTTP